jgi:hypothetical protein
MWESIADTPWWFYVLVIYVFYFAYGATKPRILNIKTYLATIVVYFGILIFALSTVAELSLRSFYILSATILPGILLGWLQFHLRNIKTVRNKMQLYVSGSWFLFVLIPIIVFVKFYYLGSQLIIRADLLKQEPYLSYIVGACGLLMGLCIGRVIFIARRLKTGPYIDESELPRPR